MVVLDQAVLEKPRDLDDARRMLRLLADREHAVITGICLRHAGGRIVDHVSTAVRFLPLTDAEIEAYVASGEPMDKAGAYGIQGFGATIVDRVDGDFFSVMGLGLRRVVALLESVGLAYDFRDGVTAA